jgi:hypothetical protein
MSGSKMEAALAALATALDAATTVAVIRNSDRPEAIPATGLVVLRDGAQGEVEESFSPLRYHIEHVAEVVVLAPDEETRDDVLAELSTALAAARTLSGAIEYLVIDPISFDLGDYDAAEAVRAALMPVRMYYTTLASPAA